MNATSSTAFIKNLIPQMIQMFEDAKAKDFHMIWDAAIPYVMQHVLAIVLWLIGIVLFALLTYFATGRWFLLGRVLYTYIHGAMVILCGFLFGPEIYANDIFEVLNVVIYIVAFITVGSILDSLGIRRRY